MTLRASQRETLELIGRFPKRGLTPRDIADAFGISREAAQLRMERLRNVELLETYWPGGSELRAVLTPKGRELL